MRIAWKYDSSLWRVKIVVYGSPNYVSNLTDDLPNGIFNSSAMQENLSANWDTGLQRARLPVVCWQQNEPLDIV